MKHITIKKSTSNDGVYSLTKEGRAIIADSNKRIGHYYDSATGMPARAMPLEAEQILLPSIIGCSASDPSFNKKVLEWYADFDIPVPAEGITLNIEITNAPVLKPDGKELKIKKYDDEGELIEEVYYQPENILDFIKYKLAVRHPRVAINKDEADSNHLKEFYIEDQTIIATSNRKALTDRKKASKLFLDLVSDVKEKEKVKYVLELMKDKHHKSVRNITPTDAELLLEQMANQYPKEFTDIVGDEKLENKAFILNLTNVGILKKEGNAFWNQDQLIGDDLDAAARYFTTDKGKIEATKLKAQYDAKLKSIK